MLAVLPLPAPWVEAIYARGLYPALQRRLIPIGNAAPLPLFDLALLALALGAAVWVTCWRRGARSAHSGGVVGAMFWRTLVVSSALYLWFLATWGLNYRRAPLAAELDYDPRRVTPAAIRSLADRTVDELNQLHLRAHHGGWPALDDLPAQLEPAVRRALRLLDLPMPGAPRPHLSLVSRYFRWAGIDGMMDPFFLEVLLNPDLAPFERPFAFAHEWAHLVGLAREGEASFVAWLSCQLGSEAMRYSGWLALAPYVWSALDPASRPSVVGRLEVGPRRDLAAIDARLARAVPALRRVAWRSYDQFLKAQRVETGIASYDEVVRLVLAVRLPAADPERSAR